MMPNSPVIFWYWNGNPTPDIICRQLRQIRDAGFAGVSPHPMPENFNRQNFLRGMTLSYPGETFFQRIRLVVKECRRLGLFVTLYDEGGWPSGSANGAILDKHPEYAAQALTRDQKTGKCRLKKFEFRPCIFRREATDEFLRLTHEQYYRVMPEEFGETIQGIFTDEPRPVGRVGSDEIPWAPDVETFFAECCGGEPEQFYPMLFPTKRLTPEIRRIRALYIKCMTEIARRNYFRPIADWCRKHQIAFEGHLNGEDEYSRHAAEFGNYLQLMDEFDVPGADAIWRQIFQGEADGEFLKFTSSAAIRNHRSVAQCEFGNVYGHGTTTPELNALANEHLIRGINRLSLMPFLYRGGFDDQLGCCTDYSPRSPLWRLYPALTAHWRHAGGFDAGALDTESRIAYDPSLPDSDTAAKKMDRRLKQRIAELDRQWIFWRFAFPEECHYHAPFQPILRNLGSQGQFRLLPCLRNDGADAIMVFHPGRKNAIFRFEAAESVFYEEIAEESSPSPLLSPLHRIAGGYEAKFAPGELRIFRRSECPSAPIPQLRPKMFSPVWTLELMEEYRYGKYDVTIRSRYRKTFLDPKQNLTAHFPDISGVLHVTAELYCEDGNMPQFLQFPELGSGGILFVNGKQSDIRAFAPWAFRLTGLQPGKNRLELELPFSEFPAWKRCTDELAAKGFQNQYSQRICKFRVSSPALRLKANLLFSSKRQC